MRSEFVEELKNTVEEMINNIHTILPGKILKYNAGRAQVLPLGKFVTPDGEIFDYPIISDVPVLLIEDENEDISISRPIKPKQGCILLFAEQALENWYYNGGATADLKFDLTNAICIPGLFRFPSKNTAEAIKKDAIIIKNKTKKITVLKDKITIDGDTYTNGDVIVNGISFLGHTHMGVHGVTSPPLG